MISVFRQRGRFCLTSPMDLLTHFSQEEPFDLSQKPPGLPSLRLSQSDGESVPGSSCQEEDEESLYRRSQYSPEVDQHEPAGDQYIPELEEGGQGSPDEPGQGERQKQQKYQQDLDDEMFNGESVAEGQSKDPRGNRAKLLQSETPCESDAALGDKVHRQSYEYFSEIDHQQELDDPEQNKEKLDGFHEDIDVAETN